MGQRFSDRHEVTAERINILESQGYDFSRFKPEKAPNYIREVGYFKNTLTLRDSIRGRRKGY